MNKLVIGFVLFFVSASLAVTCPTIEDSCSGLAGQCTTQTACTVCTNGYSACVSNASNSDCDCLTAQVACLAAAKNPYCPSAQIFDYCKETYDNCTCGTPYYGAVTQYNCQTNAFCENSTATCVALKTAGQSCTQDEQCGTGSLYEYPISCSSGICVQQKTAFAYPNDACNVDADCVFFSEGLGCDATNKVCKFHAVGDACTEEGSCGAAAFCNATTNRCQANYAAGAACYTTNENGINKVCGRTMLCGGQSKCVEYYSQDSGAACISSLECKGDLVCLDSTGKCAAALPERSCNNNTDCTSASPDYYGCDCGLCLRDTKEAVKCQPSEVSLYQCMLSNNCYFDANLIPNGCVQKNCNDEVLCNGACFLSFPENANAQCLVEPVVCPTPDSSASVVASSVALILVAFALLF